MQQRGPLVLCGILALFIFSCRAMEPERNFRVLVEEFTQKYPNLDEQDLIQSLINLPAHQYVQLFANPRPAGAVEDFLVYCLAEQRRNGGVQKLIACYIWPMITAGCVVITVVLTKSLTECESSY